MRGGGDMGDALDSGGERKKEGEVEAMRRERRRWRRGGGGGGEGNGGLWELFLGKVSWMVDGVG